MVEICKHVAYSEAFWARTDSSQAVSDVLVGTLRMETWFWCTIICHYLLLWPLERYFTPLTFNAPEKWRIWIDGSFLFELYWVLNVEEETIINRPRATPWPSDCCKSCFYGITASNSVPPCVGGPQDHPQFSASPGGLPWLITES
jgi:hypothetical protein